VRLEGAGVAENPGEDWRATGVVVLLRFENQGPSFATDGAVAQASKGRDARRIAAALRLAHHLAPHPEHGMDPRAHAPAMIASACPAQARGLPR